MSSDRPDETTSARPPDTAGAGEAAGRARGRPGVRVYSPVTLLDVARDGGEVAAR
jgi:hypothetical protein